MGIKRLLIPGSVSFKIVGWKGPFVPASLYACTYSQERNNAVRNLSHNGI